LSAATATGAPPTIVAITKGKGSKDAVTTPGGCTIDGILELEEGKLRVTLIKAVVKATQRARTGVRVVASASRRCPASLLADP
jgi:pyrroline-5-carboxylate reductase